MMQERPTTRRTAAYVLILVAFVFACGGDGGPTDPGNGDDGFNVSGTWMVTATVIESTCPDFEPGDEETVQLVIQHQGNQITFIIGGLGALTGTIDVETGDFEIDVSIFVPGTGTLRLQESGRFTSETHYTSEEIITFEDEEVACQFRTTDEGTRIAA